MLEWLIVSVLFFAFFVQALTGFGSALIAMPLLIGVVGIDTAAPLFALIAQTASIGILIRYRKQWQWREVWRVAVGALIAIPIGVWGAHRLEEHTVMVMLGFLTTGYAAYSLIGLRVPAIQNQHWAYGIGMVAGLLHGAYNTGGPPLVIYGNSQQWQPRAFKSNLQSLFFINGFLALATHFATGHITGHILLQYLIAIPIVIIAQQLGFSLDKHINPERFRKVVQVLLLVLGLL
jgi:uncharacterized membrane protein YfcA